MQITIQKKNRQKTIEVSIVRVVNRLFGVMKSHIGRDSYILRSRLFKAVYGMPEDDLGELQYIALWDILKRAMHRCRQKTKCFITNRRALNGEYQYFVVRDSDDAIIYDLMAKRTIRNLNAMTARAYKSAEEGWHRQEWKLK